MELSKITGTLWVPPIIRIIISLGSILGKYLMDLKNRKIASLRGPENELWNVRGLNPKP